MDAHALPRLHFGYHKPNYTFPGTAPAELFDRVAANAEAAEAAGFDLVTVMDHFYQITGVGPEEQPMLEGYLLASLPPERRTQVRATTPDEAAELVGRYQNLGYRGFVLRNAGGLMSPEGIALAGEVIRLVRPEAGVPA